MYQFFICPNIFIYLCVNILTQSSKNYANYFTCTVLCILWLHMMESAMCSSQMPRKPSSSGSLHELRLALQAYRHHHHWELRWLNNICSVNVCLQHSVLFLKMSCFLLSCLSSSPFGSVPARRGTWEIKRMLRGRGSRVQLLATHMLE